MSGRERAMDEPTAPSAVSAARNRLTAGLPVRSQRLDVAGTGTFVTTGGEGPPLVLLHGGIESGGAYWAPAVEALAATHHLVIPDAPGLGESEPVTGRLGAAEFSTWLAELVRLTCAQPPVLVAHSLLGTLAARFAARHSALLRHLVLWAAPGLGPYRLPAGLLVAAIRLDVRPTERNLARFAAWPFLDLTRARTRDPSWFDAFFAYQLERTRAGHVKRTMRSLLRTCTKQVPDADLQAITAPAALLWGRHDRMVPLRVGEYASRKHGWPLHVMDDAGHVPHVEDPATFVSTLHRAIADGGGGSR
jgi:2-hydroxymuconate-semialdehyde hydrolase